MISFTKPENLDGNILETKLKTAGIIIPERSIYVEGNLVYLDITEPQKETAQSVLDSLA